MLSRCTCVADHGAAGLGLPTSAGPALALDVDGFALRHDCRHGPAHRRGHPRCIDVLPDRKAATLAARLRKHPEVEMVCRDGSAALRGDHPGQAPNVNTIPSAARPRAMPSRPEHAPTQQDRPDPNR
mgnify:CR=1 FL=1